MRAESHWLPPEPTSTWAATPCVPTARVSARKSPRASVQRYHDPQGPQLQGKPAKKGLYIHEGRKTVVE
ncbi:MAG: hypothetical protein IKG77_02565 [Prevotella sp.]|nr:hypothetical protein [Prevotella sp.]